MPLIEWEEHFATGEEQIDVQHQKLVAIANNLYQAMSERRSKEVLEQVLQELVDYTEYHFLTEERYFQSNNHPLSSEHVEKHRAFERKIKELSQAYVAGKRTMSIEMMNFLSDWVRGHILGDDQHVAKMRRDSRAKLRLR